jgi:hypothetical protein
MPTGNPSNYATSYTEQSHRFEVTQMDMKVCYLLVSPKNQGNANIRLKTESKQQLFREY